MPHLSLRVSDELLAELDAAADERDVSRSDYVRGTLENHQQVEELQRENERLRNQLAATNARQDDVGELVEYVEHERRVEQRREQRRSAPVWRRAWRWVIGYDAEDDSA
jgi:metal-responsive CopG/Arc/MetJ family transcriptional regulator